MGIPRLFSDLQHYSERVRLGRNDPEKVVDLLIDGPSLVYLVYNRLLAYKSQSGNVVASIPIHKELGHAVLHFLDDLESYGTEIQKIYFDGGLPIEKRTTRHARLERSKEELTGLRKAFPQGLALPKSSSNTNIDYSAALWGSHIPSAILRGLPIPSFMVPVVLETLKTSRFGTAVEQVPGEADQFCAAKSRRTGWHILTNDSDLPLYDSGDSSRIIWLSTISRLQTDGVSGKYHVSALSIKPTNAAKSLHLSSLCELGFERLLDSTASASIIRQRAGDVSRREPNRIEFEQFCKQYTLPFPISTSSLEISSLDPRVSELALQLCAYSTQKQGSGPLHIYFPAVLEDPSRDASWAYGSEYRQAAYSLLAHATSCQQLPVTIIEMFRKGGHIGETEVLVSANHGDIPSCLTDNRDVFAEFARDAPDFLVWTGFALTKVLEQKRRTGKSLPPEEQLWNVLGFYENRARVSWGVVHLHACVQAILYSLRMLQQVATMIQAHCDQCSMATSYAIDMLKTLPTISDLFLSNLEIIERAASLPGTQVKRFVDAALNGRHEISRQHLEAAPALPPIGRRTRKGSNLAKSTITSQTPARQRPVGRMKDTNNYFGALSDIT